MKITICNSVQFWKEAEDAQQILRQMGHDAATHPMEVEFRGKKVSAIEYYKARKTGWDEEIERLKEWAVREHFDKVMNSDAILVLNYDKNGVKGYVGGNTLMEMGLAFAMRKKIFILNSVPEELPYAEEIKGVKPIVLNGVLEGLK
jgi:hypothetical protein